MHRIVPTRALQTLFDGCWGSLRVWGLMGALAGCTAHIEGDALGSGSPAAAGSGPSSMVPGGNGSVGGSTGSMPEPATSTTTGVPGADACKTSRLGPTKLRRLTANQFRSSLTDLFGDANVPSVTLFSDPQVLGFTSDADALQVQGLTAQQLADYAERVASWAVDNKLDALSTCKTADDGCRKSFVETFGKRAFREPLPAERVTAYTALMAAEPSFAAGVEAAITAMLQSPHFVYRRELGGAVSSTGTTPLTAYEVASSLSYLLRGTMPDNALMAAADDGSILTPTKLDAEAERLLQDPRSQAAVFEFFNGWLGLSKLDVTPKDESQPEELKQALKAESKAFILDLFNNGGTVGQLFSASHSFLNQTLAEHYAISPSNLSLGTELVRVSYDGLKRDPGLLGHGGLLTGYADAGISSPVKRGKFVLMQLLCQQLPPPPSNLDTKLAPPVATQTTRQHFEQHSKNPVCAACHQRMDPIGFAFEHYDEWGRYREQENGINVDASGHTAGLASGDATFKGVKELSAFLAQSPDVASCAVRYWSYYAFGLASWKEDGCTYDFVQNAAAPSNMKLRDILLGIVRSPNFTQRAAN